MIEVAPQSKKTNTISARMIVMSDDQLERSSLQDLTRRVAAIEQKAVTFKVLIAVLGAFGITAAGAFGYAKTEISQLLQDLKAAQGNLAQLQQRLNELGTSDTQRIVESSARQAVTEWFAKHGGELSRPQTSSTALPSFSELVRSNPCYFHIESDETSAVNGSPRYRLGFERANGLRAVPVAAVPTGAAMKWRFVTDGTIAGSECSAQH